MKNLFIIGIVTTAALVLIPTCDATPDEVGSYERQLISISSTLTDRYYYSNFLKDSHRQKTQVGPCNSAAFCRNGDIKRILLSIQNGSFKFILPVMVPIDAQELLSGVQSLSQCKDLGFMNVKQIQGQGGAAPVPYRPTEGFGIYKLPMLARETLLVRGSEYNLAWPSWGADTTGIRLPPTPPQSNSLGGDFLTEIDARSCKVIQQFNLERLDVLTETNYLHESFSEPIQIGGQVYILQILADKSFKNETVFSLELIKLNIITGQVSGTFRYVTTFKE